MEKEVHLEVYNSDNGMKVHLEVYNSDNGMKVHLEVYKSDKRITVDLDGPGYLLISVVGCVHTH